MERQTITNQNADRAGRLRNQYLAKRLKAIKGSLKNCIDSHGPITRERIQSAAKRIHGQLVGMEREELKMTQQTSTTAQPEQPDPTPQTALHYLARIGTLEGLWEQAKQRRDKAEAQVTELKRQLEGAQKEIRSTEALLDVYRDLKQTDLRGCQREVAKLRNSYAALEQFMGVSQAKMAQEITELRNKLETAAVNCPRCGKRVVSGE